VAKVRKTSSNLFRDPQPPGFIVRGQRRNAEILQRWRLKAELLAAWSPTPTAPPKPAKKTSTQHDRLIAMMRDLVLPPDMLPREVRKEVISKYKAQYKDEPSHTAVTNAYRAYVKGYS
jgi:hypothetical protein